jgi:hypothetical protein
LGGIAVVQLDIGKVAMLCSDHPFFAELPIQMNALCVKLPRRPEVALHTSCDSLQMQGHSLEPRFPVLAREIASLLCELGDAANFAPTECDAAKHAEPVNLARQIAGGPGRFDQFLGQTCSLVVGARPERRQRPLVKVHESGTNI